MIKTLVIQVIIMFLLSMVGYIMFKAKKISKEGSKSIGNILIFLSLPCVMINGLINERTKENIIGLLISAALAFLVLIISTVVSRLIFKKDAIAAFSSAFSNPGFFGVPLIISSISEGAVFYVASFIVFLNFLQWTYGVYIMTEDKSKISIKNVLKAPAVIAAVIGLIIFFGAIEVPTIIAKIIVNIANLNTPLAMFTIGIYMAQTDIKNMFVKKELYYVSFVRLILIPVISILLLWLVPADYMDLKYAVLIAAACPVGSNVAVYAELHNKNYTYAVETVVISTLFSILSIPAVVYLAGIVW